MKATAEFLAPSKLDPGWYYDIPEDVYHSWNLCSNSRLSVIRDSSPAHLRYQIEHPEQPTEALLLGSATHYAILQPGLFDLRYFALPDCDRRTKDGKAEYESCIAANPGKIPLKAAAYESCRNMAAAVWANLDARILLESLGQLELSGIFERDGVLCKMRVDKLSEEYGATIDVKTCQCAHPREFERVIYNRGYHRQGAFYVDGAWCLESPFVDHFIIAVEKEPPYATVVYKLTADALDLGRKELNELLATYRRCVESQSWPGYPEGLVEIGVPVWAFKTLED